MFETLVARCVNDVLTDSFTINSEDTITIVNEGLPVEGVFQKVGLPGWVDTATTISIPTGSTVLVIDSNDVSFGPNGTRLKLNLTTTLGVFTSDSIGDQAPGGLSFQPVRNQLGKGTTDLTAADTLELIYSGQSNGSRHAVAIEDWPDAQIFSANIINAADGGAGFANGRWVPNSDNESKLAGQIRELDPSSYTAGVFFIHGENDSSSVENAELYYDRLLTLKGNVAKLSGYDLPWFMLRLNAVVANDGTAKMREIQSRLAQENGIILIDVDDIAMSDALHYATATYRDVIFPRLLDFINREKLLFKVGSFRYEEGYKYAPARLSAPFIGVVFNALFNDTADSQLSDYTPEVGSIEIRGGDWLIGPTGDTAHSNAAGAPAPTNHLFLTPAVEGEVVRIEADMELADNSIAGPIVRYVDDLNFIACAMNLTAPGVWRCRTLQYIDGSLTALESLINISETPTFNVVIEDDGNEIRITVNGTDSFTTVTTTHGTATRSGFRTNRADDDVLNMEVQSLEAFS